MPELSFNRQQALEAIHRSQQNGIDWLYQTYPKPNGRSRRSISGFLMHEGVPYPVKPLGRLASEIAGQPMTDNPITNVFRRHFEHLGFQLIESATDEAEDAVGRQKGLASVWERPDQARFRRAIFDRFGARCLITGCDTLIVLEAAHIRPVSDGGMDDAWNGIPLRADIHRLFDANMLRIDPDIWRVAVSEAVRAAYGRYHGLDLRSHFENQDDQRGFAEAFHRKNSLG